MTGCRNGEHTPQRPRSLSSVILGTITRNVEGQRDGLDALLIDLDIIFLRCKPRTCELQYLRLFLVTLLKAVFEILLAFQGL